MTQVAFNNDPGLKQALLTSIAQHRAADKLLSGAYHDPETGAVCAVGCNIAAVREYTKTDTLEWGDHAGLGEAIGVPAILLRLQDYLFERLPIAERLEWPTKFAEAITPGADLSMVWPRFAVRLLDRRISAGQDKKGVIKVVRDLYARWIAGDRPTREEFLEARRAAYAAAAADAAADAAAYAAAAAAERKQQAADLIELLEAARGPAA